MCIENRDVSSREGNYKYHRLRGADVMGYSNIILYTSSILLVIRQITPKSNQSQTTETPMLIGKLTEIINTKDIQNTTKYVVQNTYSDTISRDDNQVQQPP